MTTITRAAAQIQMLPRFFTGEPCRNGHISERITHNGKCIQCKREAEQRRYEKHKSSILEYRRHLRSLPEHKQYALDYAMNLRSTRPELVKSRQKAWYDNGGNAWFKLYRSTTTGHRVSLLANLKSRAKAQGLDFNLTHQDLIPPATCPVLGIPIVAGRDQMHDSSPSVDRVDNTKGYTTDNVRVISMRANRLKSDATPQELELILLYIRNHIISNGNTDI